MKDVLNDTSFNGLTDILKRNESTVDKLFSPISNDEAIEFAGIRFKQTTTAPTVTISSNTYYNTYIYSDDAIFSVFLGKNPQTGEKAYRLSIGQAPANGSVADPVRVIGGWVAYNVCKILALFKSLLIDSNPVIGNEAELSPAWTVRD